jgi:ABC-2 type transport system ATP-binding protein
MIALEHVTKTFANGHGIFDLSFAVAQGEVFGYLDRMAPENPPPSVS